MSVKVLTVKEDLLGANDQIARANRDLLDKHHVFMINITSSPGAGKTSLILKTINHFRESTRIAVIEGDIASSVDADKVSEMGIPAVQINTGGGCHLDANMVKKGLEHVDLDKTDLVLIENVGNLICTAGFALGEHKNVMLLSVPEGDDKPIKYPLMFAESDVVLISKIDVLPYFDFNTTTFSKMVSGLNPSANILPVSCKTGEGLEAWYSWLEGELLRKNAQA
jgi:hydrogenase nickel incorporation protein HypB